MEVLNIKEWSEQKNHQFIFLNEKLTKVSTGVQRLKDNRVFYPGMWVAIVNDRGINYWTTSFHDDKVHVNLKKTGTVDFYKVTINELL